MYSKFTLTFVIVGLTLTTCWACEDDDLPGNSRVPYDSGTELPEMDDSFVEVPIEPFQFLNCSENVIYIGTNGVLSFGKPVTNFISCKNTTSPAKLIAPFWSDINIREGGKIKYEQDRTYNGDSRYTKWANAILSKTYNREFEMDWAFAVSYKNVAFFNKKDENMNKISPPCPCSGKRNSFDVLLVTDAKESYVLFHYRKLTWYSGTASGSGAKCDGTGGDFAMAGFSDGIGSDFQQISPLSCSANAADLVTGSNVVPQNQEMFPGVWVFRVDTTLQPANEQV